MIRALSGALSLVLTIVVLQIFLPEVATGLVEVLVKVLRIASAVLDQVPTSGLSA